MHNNYLELNFEEVYQDLSNFSTNQLTNGRLVTKKINQREIHFKKTGEVFNVAE